MTTWWHPTDMSHWNEKLLYVFRWEAIKSVLWKYLAKQNVKCQRPGDCAERLQFPIHWRLLDTLTHWQHENILMIWLRKYFSSTENYFNQCVAGDESGGDSVNDVQWFSSWSWWWSRWLILWMSGRGWTLDLLTNKTWWTGKTVLLLRGVGEGWTQ